MPWRRWLTWGAGGWVAWRLLGPEPQPRFRHPQVNPLPVPGRSVFVGGNEYFVRDTGPRDVPTLVLVHGWNLDGAMTFHRVIPELARKYRVVVPDLRDHGKSDWVRGRVEIADLADDVAGILDTLELGRSAVLGYSMGGMVVQELARRHPRHIGKLILAATAAQPIPRIRPLARIAFWLTRAGLRFSQAEAALVTGELLGRGGAVLPEHRRWMHQALLKRDADLYYEIGAAVWRFDSRSWVAQLPQSKLIIIPTDDEVVPPETQYELARLLPDAEVVEIRGGFHESVMNRADEYVAAISSFLG